LDPPALIKRKKDFKAGYEAYRRLNHLALQVLAKDGILVSASCSYHLSKANLHEILRSSARHIDRNITVLRVNVDFPVWIIDSLDKEANRIGVTRQSIIKKYHRLNNWRPSTRSPNSPVYSRN
jgi:hypothetical protein